MFSYAGKTQKEIDDYRKKVKELNDVNYKGKVDKNGRWINPSDGQDAVFLDGNTCGINLDIAISNI